MEEDNQEISGWNDDEHFNILDSKSLIKSKKKQSQIILNEPKILRKLKPSHTLPVLKNIRRSLIKENDNAKEKIQDPNVDKLDQKFQKRLTKAQRVYQIENYIKQNSYNLLKGQNIDVANKNVENQIRTEENSLSNSKFFMQKHSNTVIKQNEESNIRKLKIEASEYCSTPKNLSVQDKERTKQLLLKLKQNFSKDFSKNLKSKYFIVKKQRLSPQKVSQEISKIAIESKRSCQEAETSSPERVNQILKERYKNIVKNVQVQRKNSCININAKSQQLRKFSNQKKKNKTQMNNLNSQQGNLNDFTSDKINERDPNLLSQKVQVKNSSILQFEQYQKIKKSKKLNQILEHSQQFSKSLRSNRQKSLKMLRLSNQIDEKQFTKQISMKKVDNLSFILANKHKNTAFEKLTLIDQKREILKTKQTRQISRKENKNHRIKLLSQPSVPNEFNDQYLFVQK